MTESRVFLKALYRWTEVGEVDVIIYRRISQIYRFVVNRELRPVMFGGKRKTGRMRCGAARGDNPLVSPHVTDSRICSETGSRQETVKGEYMFWGATEVKAQTETMGKKRREKRTERWRVDGGIVVLVYGHGTVSTFAAPGIWRCRVWY